MAFFGPSRTFLGLDLSTSTIKLVELVDRKKRLEVTTYAQANLPNLLISSGQNDDEIIRKTARVISHMLDKAQAVADLVIAALPSSVVFSTLLMLPDLTGEEMEKAVRFAARDVVPLDIDDMVLGWSRVGEDHHMEITKALEEASPINAAMKPVTPVAKKTVPVFVTAAPAEIVTRYIKLSEQLKLHLYALELETFPLARSLLIKPNSVAMIIDVGAAVTTFHIIDRGTPRLSYSLDMGGNTITVALAKALGIAEADAEQLKIQEGLSEAIPAPGRAAMEQAIGKIQEQAKLVLQAYARQSPSTIGRTILIGGGALLKGFPEHFSQAIGHPVVIGDPWRGLAYPQALEQHFQELGPQYAVAVGLALRGFKEEN